MSTRSNIIAKHADGRYSRIYVHSDSYLEGVGKTLLDHYTSRIKIEKLIKLGDLSTLGPKIGSKVDFDLGQKLYRMVDKKEITKVEADKRRAAMYDQCRAYGRDRGEKGTEAGVFADLEAAWPYDSGVEFVYLYADGKWQVGDPDKGPSSLVDLGAALKKEVEIAPAIKAFGGNFVIGQHGSNLKP